MFERDVITNFVVKVKFKISRNTLFSNKTKVTINFTLWSITRNLHFTIHWKVENLIIIQKDIFSCCFYDYMITIILFDLSKVTKIFSQHSFLFRMIWFYSLVDLNIISIKSFPAGCCEQFSFFFYFWFNDNLIEKFIFLRKLTFLLLIEFLCLIKWIIWFHLDCHQY